MTEPNIFAREPGKLGIRIPRSAWKAAGHSASAAMRQKGFLLSQGQLSEWIADDLQQIDDEVICYGPGFDGQSLEELLHSGLGDSTLLEHLSSVAKALSRLEHGDGRPAGSPIGSPIGSSISPIGIPAGIQSAGILVSADGNVLVLPPALVSRAAARVQSGAGPGPEGDPANAASALLARTLRRIFLSRLAGRTKHSGATSGAGGLGHSDFADRRSGEPYVPLGLIAPRLDPALAALADHGMDQGSASPSLADWAGAFEAAARHQYFRELSAEQLASIELQRKSAETRAGKKIARKRFMTKRGSLLAGLALSAVVIAGIAIFDRPPTGPDLSDLGPEDLVRAYYEAIDTLDMARLEASLQGKAGRDDRSMVSNLTVVTKMRQAYSPDALFTRADDWVAAGSPELGEGALMYGITELEIRSLSPPAAGQLPAGNARAVESGTAVESRIEARYTLWTTEGRDQVLRGVASRRLDRLVLVQGKKGWKIISIERESL